MSHHSFNIFCYERTYIMFPILFLICLDSANRKISKTGGSESSAVSRQANKVLLHQGTIDAL